MQIKIVNDADGCPAVQVVSAATGAIENEVELKPSETVVIDVAGVADTSGFVIGEVTPTEAAPETPASDGGTPVGEGETPAPAEGEQPPAGEPTTSAASEKPLYLVDGDAIPEGFDASGLETPDGKTLYHFGSDTAGQSATGNADGVSVYADADDDEKPVQAAEPTAENADTGAGASA